MGHKDSAPPSPSFPPPPPAGPLPLPSKILYTTSAKIGGPGLDKVAAESLKVGVSRGLLAHAIAYGLNETSIPANLVTSLRWSPVRLLSSLLDSTHYYAAKKRWLDRHSARLVTRENFDLVHTWSGDCLQTLKAAKAKGIPSLLEIPTWHRHKGTPKSHLPNRKERQTLTARGWAGWKNRLLITRQETLEEYALASLILVLSAKAEETFLAEGFPKEKLFRHHRGVDTLRFTPASRPPDTFRVVFVGSLVKRKGVHILLQVWDQLALPHAELVLVGTPHPEIQPYLEKYGSPSVKLPGFVHNVAEHYRNAAIHVFPSSCEGSAKCTYEAAACGLPQITTREAGDVVEHDISGLIIPPENPNALASALLRLYEDRSLATAMGAAARLRVEQHFTWNHFGNNLLKAYQAALQIR